MGADGRCTLWRMLLGWMKRGAFFRGGHFLKYRTTIAVDTLQNYVAINIATTTFEKPTHSRAPGTI